MNADYVGILEAYAITDGGKSETASKSKVGFVATIKIIFHKIGEALKRFARFIKTKLIQFKNWITHNQSAPATSDKPIKPIVATLQSKLEANVQKWAPRVIEEGKASIDSGEQMVNDIMHTSNYEDSKRLFENHAQGCKEMLESLNSYADPILEEAKEKNTHLRCSTIFATKTVKQLLSVSDRTAKFVNASILAHGQMESKFNAFAQSVNGKPLNEDNEMRLKYFRTATNAFLFCTNTSYTVYNSLTALATKYFPDFVNMQPNK